MKAHTNENRIIQIHCFINTFNFVVYPVKKKKRKKKGKTIQTWHKVSERYSGRVFAFVSCYINLILNSIIKSVRKA